MIPDPTPLSITPMERFTLRRIQAGVFKESGARFAYHARSDGRVAHAVTGAGFDWTGSGSARTLEEAQQSVAALVASRKEVAT